MTRYAPSRSYLTAALAAVALGAPFVWLAKDHFSATAAAGLFWLCAVSLLYLATRPPVTVQREKLVIGRREIDWLDIRRVDRSGWLSPLVLNLTLDGGTRIRLIYPGDLDSANSLLRHIRKRATAALIDGIPHPHFWGETAAEEPPAGRLSAPPYRLLLREDEEEVERLFRRLKSVGHLDSNSSGEE
jgi:hypothetical protein